MKLSSYLDALSAALRSPGDDSRGQLGTYALLLLFAAALLLPAHPVFMQTLNTDSGVFFYIGWRILHGELPYLDIWDHKPFIIYYINAAGLFFSGGGRWGVWLLELMSLWGSLLIAAKLFRSVFEKHSRVMLIAAFGLGFYICFEGGNLTEEYGLPLQAAAFLMVWREVSGKRSLLHSVAIGAFAGLLLFLKPTLTGIFFAYMGFLLLRFLMSKDWRYFIKSAAAAFGGLAFAVALMAVLLASQGILGEFYSQAIAFNFQYVDVDFIHRIRSMIFGFGILSDAGITFLASFGLWIFLMTVFRSRRGLAPVQMFMIFVVFEAIVSYAFAGLSGKEYAHYFLTLVPSVSCLAAFGYEWIHRRLSVSSDGRQLEKVFFATAITAILFLAFPNALKVTWSLVTPANREIYKVVHLIEKKSEPHESVLALGSQTRLNFLSKRKSPTRYAYQTPLSYGWGAEREKESFFRGVLVGGPRIIVTQGRLDSALFKIAGDSDPSLPLLMGVLSRYQKSASVLGYNFYNRLPVDTWQRQP